MEQNRRRRIIGTRDNKIDVDVDVVGSGDRVSLSISSSVAALDSG